MMNDHEGAQRVPVKTYASDDRVTVAAPMPGLRPEDIFVEVSPGNQLVLHGDARGALKGLRRTGWQRRASSALVEDRRAQYRALGDSPTSRMRPKADQPRKNV